MVTNDDIAAYVDGTADPATALRVVAAAIADRSVRERVALLRAAEVAPDEDTPLAPSRVDRLHSRMLLVARAVAEETRGGKPAGGDVDASCEGPARA